MEPRKRATRAIRPRKREYSFDYDDLNFTKPVKLYESQIENFDVGIQRLKEDGCVFNNSIQGVGKGPITIALGYHFNLPGFIVCPGANTETVWRKECDKYKYPHELTRYSQLRRTKIGKKKKDEKMIDWLIYDASEPNLFKPTQILLDLIEEGALFIFDEAHKASNKTLQNKSCLVLTQAVYQSKSKKSKAVFLTASPYTNINCAVAYLRLLNILKQPELYKLDRSSRVQELTGLNEILEKCKAINSDATDEVFSRYRANISSKMVNKVVHDLFTQVIIKYYYHGIGEPDIGSDIKRDFANGFYELDIEESLDLLRKHVQEGLQMLSEHGDNQQVRQQVAKNYRKVEIYKVSIYARAPKRFLDRNPGSKVIIGVNRLATLRALAAEYESYNCVVINGAVSQEERVKLFSKFEEDPDCRVLIGIMSIVSCSLNFHDQVGNSKRAAFVSPGNSLKDMEQFRKRIERAGTKSDIYVRIMYARDVYNELELMNTINRSASTLKSTLSNIKENLLLICDFPNDYSLD